MTDLYSIPQDQRTREEVRTHYYETFPLLKAYDEITRERNSVPNADINDPASSPTAVTTMTATELALVRIGKPPRDRADVLYAERYIREVQREMEGELPPSPDASPLLELVISGVYALAGCVPDAESWAGFDTETQEFELEEIMAGAPDHTDALKALLLEALQYGMPAVLREITARYGRRQSDSAATEDDKSENIPDGERRYSPDEAAALLMAAATGAPTMEEAVEYLQNEVAAGTATDGDDLPLSVEVMSSAARIGLTDARRTLDELRARHSRGDWPDLAQSISAWEDAVARLEALAGPPVVSRRRTDG